MLPPHKHAFENQKLCRHFSNVLEMLFSATTAKNYVTNDTKCKPQRGRRKKQSWVGQCGSNVKTAHEIKSGKS